MVHDKNTPPGQCKIIIDIPASQKINPNKKNSNGYQGLKNMDIVQVIATA